MRLSEQVIIKSCNRNIQYATVLWLIMEFIISIRHWTIIANNLCSLILDMKYPHMDAVSE